MRKRSFLVAGIIICIFLLTGIRTFAQSDSFPGLAPSVGAERFAETFDPTDWEDQVALALWASGNPGLEAETVVALRPFITELRNSTKKLDDRDKAEKVLEFIHDNFLKSYSLKQTRFDTLLENGRYNCVSSAVLYAIAGTAVGLDISGIMTVDHAFCTVNLGLEDADVETTSPYGFAPGTKKEFLDAFGETTGFAYVPPRNYRDRKPIDLLHLFSLILSNRMSDAESAGKFPEAVELAVDRWILLGGNSGQAYEDLIDRMINYGVYLSGKGKEAEALEWAQLAVAAHGDHFKWRDFTDSAANNLLVRLIRSGDIAEARIRLEELKPRLSEEVAGRMDLSISDAELLDALSRVEAGGPEADFYAALSAAEEKGVLPPQRTREVEVVWRLEKIQQTARLQGWSAAYEETKTVIGELGSDSQLEKALRVYRENRIAEMYNAAAAAYNAGGFAEAAKIADDALVEFPAEPRLLKLKAAAVKALSETIRDTE